MIMTMQNLYDHMPMYIIFIVFCVIFADHNNVIT